jgi:2-polyprenyl-3-methyl-5-hydroxy-6-metoxy-1,4-benzoquinol methylase
MNTQTAVEVLQPAEKHEGKFRCPGCSEYSAAPFLRVSDRFHGRQVPYQLMRCPSCSLVWQLDPPAPEQMGEHYGPDYDRAVAAAGDSPERWKGRVKTLAQYKTGGSLLDLGCSSGGFLQAIARPSWQLYGIEMSESVARRAESASGAQIFVGDILDAPYTPESFDVITCFHVFEHLYEPRAVMKKVMEWLKPGGLFYLMVPNIDSAGAKIFQTYWYALEMPRHISHFSPKSLSVLAESVGLEQESLSTHREPFIENSVRYWLDERFRKAGMPRTPLAKQQMPGIPYRIIRKAFRLTTLPLLNGLVALAGDGESIHAVFRKPSTVGHISERDIAWTPRD